MIGICRSSHAPRILIEGTAADRYRSKEVVDRLFADFHDKCYICEIKPVQDAQVEHLRPHKNDSIPDRKFNWHNLFLVCGHCNGVKNKAKYNDCIIDCCARDPEALLEQELVENEVHVGLLSTDDQEACATAELIQETFMSTNPPLTGKDARVRLKALQECMNLLFRRLGEYKTDPTNPMAKRSLKALLAKNAAFAGFTRCYVRKHLNEYPQLEYYLM